MLCLLLVGRKKKRRREMGEGFYSRARQALLDVLQKIIVVVRCN
jgi:hypothetical protein